MANSVNPYMANSVDPDQMANIVDPDEMAHYEPSHLDQRCLQRYLFFAKVSVFVYRAELGPDLFALLFHLYLLFFSQ